MNETVYLLYTNHRGETAWRVVRPIRLFLGESPHHPGRQWLLEVWDYDRAAERTYAMSGVREWRPAGCGPRLEAATAEVTPAAGTSPAPAAPGRPGPRGGSGGASG